MLDTWRKMFTRQIEEVSVTAEEVENLDARTETEAEEQQAGPADGQEAAMTNANVKKILVVDDEEDMIWSLKHNLNHKSLTAEIITASSGEQALEVLADNKIDLMITDIKMPGISGIDLLIEVRNRYPDTGVIVMTAFPSPEYKNEAILKGSLHFIEKPFDINDMRRIVVHALKDDNLFKGTIAGVELSDIIQINSLSRVTSALRVRTSDRDGIIFFEKGNVVHAVCGDIEGDEAFYDIIAFEGGVIESTKGAEAPARTISKTFEALLIEGSRRMDEAGSGNTLLTQIEDDEFEVDFGVKTTPVDAGSTDNKGQVYTITPPVSDQQMEGKMSSNLQDILNEFTNIPGVNTACLVGRDGFLLDSKALGGVDTEMIGAIASSGFGASESMGNQLGKGNMSMTMIEYNNGPVMLSPIGKEAFLVIVADRESNLGMIRLKIKKHARDIETTAAL